ncbi:MAG: ribosome maturation factor RimM [Burkholderiales bacterium]|nr:ribosome maturation factor RimM [Burkholderiales bacterium]
MLADPAAFGGAACAAGRAREPRGGARAEGQGGRGRARRELPEPEEGIYYHADLVGAEVVNTEGAVLGTVVALASNGAHEVMTLSGERTRLVPWVPAVVRRVDLARRRIEVDWGKDW